MLLFKSQALFYLAFAQLCASASIDTQDIAPRDAFLDNYGSNMCNQVGCDVMACAKNPDDALAVVSGGVSLIVGPDCVGWEEGSVIEQAPGTDNKTCSDGLTLYKGRLWIWRAWNNVGAKKYYAEFLDWENFKGAKCWGKQDVKCQKKGTKMAPSDPDTSLCVPWGL
ncbi:uncharacterized protein LY79DRAFT_675125 [Colletotrichum navitas]|uniref:Ecp2 effector protein domain-containing protein n=1 Tax=Colletotrichum navitas TaxID=681940 RepID=A0AAD8PJW6_9PEZI|nr:uncharacterized protein LY79DRAFT_675125 [Colletotrichum navitas]KAK1565842.1 hypothetical protein LY79DRAFT_675125 [Colletotrichum navitas]